MNLEKFDWHLHLLILAFSHLLETEALKSPYSENELFNLILPIESLFFCMNFNGIEIA